MNMGMSQVEDSVWDVVVASICGILPVVPAHLPVLSIPVMLVET